MSDHEVAVPDPDSATAPDDEGAAFLMYEKAILRRVTARLSLARASGLGPADLGDPEQLAERASAVIPTRHIANTIAGPFYDTGSLIIWLGVTRQALHRAVKAHRMLGCRTQDGHVVYPIWQFTADRGTIPHLREVLTILGEHQDDQWRSALWLAASAPYLEGGASAAEWLANDGDPADVLAAARHDAYRWAS